MDATWIEHRRSGDRERLGWIVPIGEDGAEGFRAVDLLGRAVTGVVDWMTAERALDALGIGYLGDPYELLLSDGVWTPVRLVEVSPTGIRAKEEDYGDVTASVRSFDLAWPLPEVLRPRS